MAFTTQDLAAIDAAIASGELMIRAADGKTVTLRTMDELLKARDTILTSMPVPLGTGTTGRHPYPHHQLTNFSD